MSQTILKGKLMSEPVYGVEVTYQSGKVAVMNVSNDRSTVDLFCRMAETLVGRADPIDGVAGVALVVASPKWVNYETPVITWSQCNSKNPHASHGIPFAEQKNTWCRGVNV